MNIMVKMLLKNPIHPIKQFKLDVLNFIKVDRDIYTEEPAAVFNIATHSTVRKWKKDFELQGIDALQPKQKGRSSMKKKTEKTMTSKGSIEDILAENERLRMENAYLKKLNALVQKEKKLKNAKKRK